MRSKGFTIIELLVVISIVSLTASIVLASINVAHAKGLDARMVADVHEAQIAIQGYTLDKNSAPGNYLDTNGTYDSSGNGNAIAFEDTANPTNPQTNSGKAYNQSMQLLVSSGYLSSIPHSPNPSLPYAYYNYGPGNSTGVLFGTSLETITPSTTGLPGSCRPFSGTNHYNAQADFNHDGNVDITDYNILSANYGLHPATQSQGDANGNGTVDFNDFLILQNAYNTSVADSPTSTNFCGASLSQDYCVCNPY